MVRSTDGITCSARETVAAKPEATHPRVLATTKGALVLWFEDSPWNNPRRLVNRREISAP